MVIYGGRLGKITEQYPKVHCPICQTPQVQIIRYLTGDPEYKCRHCRQKFTLPFTPSCEYKFHYGDICRIDNTVYTCNDETRDDFMFVCYDRDEAIVKDANGILYSFGVGSITRKN